MKHLFVLCLLALVLSACSSGTTTPVKGKIIKVGREYAPITCVGQGTSYTVIQLSEDRVAKLCGDYGNVGMTIAGFWTEGNEWDKSLNGFSLTR